MFVRDLKDCDEIVAGDNTRLRELFNPLKDPLDLRYSLAVARVEPGGTTFLHRLETSEVYYILEGEGEMHIDAERRGVGRGQAVYIPPGATQQISNTGAVELVFVCIVDPAWRVEDETILE
jgi:mannose-6-phosphate isomerase-like protein (cupin superfamily)